MDGQKYPKIPAYVSLFLLVFLLLSCQPGRDPSLTQMETPVQKSLTAAPDQVKPSQDLTPTKQLPVVDAPATAPQPHIVQLENGYLTSTELILRDENHNDRDPSQWSSWPVLPELNPYLIEVFQRGIRQGKQSDRFSVVGDCQSLPNVFLGLFDTSKITLSDQDASLGETITYYQGAFSHQSLTVIDGLSPPTALSPMWNDPAVCHAAESPLDCEFRINQPSILFINLGSNWQKDASLASYEKYMRQIIEFSLAEGVIPILSTKVDNVEGGHRINALTASLASEYQIPLWNFWRAADGLENHGLDEERDSVYLSTQAWGVRSFSALRVLDSLYHFLHLEGGSDA
jgi:hypothetical protein